MRQMRPVLSIPTSQPGVFDRAQEALRPSQNQRGDLSARGDAGQEPARPFQEETQLDVLLAFAEPGTHKLVVFGVITVGRDNGRGRCSVMG